MTCYSLEQHWDYICGNKKHHDYLGTCRNNYKALAGNMYGPFKNNIDKGHVGDKKGPRGDHKDHGVSEQWKCKEYAAKHLYLQIPNQR